MKTATLILKDGTKFEGNLYGSPKSVAGEVVFATGMVGYDISMTDPSYSGQILVFTYPLIGNWGVPPKEFWESDRIHTKAIIVGDLTTKPNHWQMQQTLDRWCKKEGVPILSGIDTRALTQKLREHGVMLGKIVVDEKDVKFEDPNLRNLVAEVSINKLKIHRPNSHPEFISGSKKIPKQVRNDSRELKIGLLNCGAKRNILNELLKRSTTVYELPWDYDPFEHNLKLDGLLISNGPGDPKMADQSIAIVKKSMEQKLPTFGVCLGNQLLALAAGGDTYKLKFGHRSQNQPALEIGTKRCYITTQNHGFAVNDKKMPKGFKPWFINANDNTNEGIKHEKLPFFSVQFHPEATPGPTDTTWLFDYFLETVKKYRGLSSQELARGETSNPRL
jgi:carbamoyl-phosphate synthase small subunit